MNTAPTNNHKNKKPLPYLFNPYEIAFCGFSGSGKTTLLEKIVNKLSKSYSIAYIKSDAHKFEIDKEGKDTFKLKKAGAKNVFINDATHFNFEGSGSYSQNLVYQNFLDNDFALIEGYKSSDIPKFVFLDDDHNILKQEDFNSKNILGFIGPSKILKYIGSIDYYHRDDVDDIIKSIFSFFKKKSDSIPLYGLILGGGVSSRMGTDKNNILIEGQTLSSRAYDSLLANCDKVFHSTRPDQNLTTPIEILEDTFLNLGPLGGILSAQKKFPLAAWVVLACDLPRVNHTIINHLTQSRNPFKMATAYRSDYSRHPEPLCTIYEPKSFSRNLQVLARGLGCPRNCLIESSIHTIDQIYSGSLDNANTPEELNRIINEASNK